MAKDRKLKDRVLEQKSHFSQYNVVRMREAVRYLSPSKLEIFIKIPVMIHVNQPAIPGFVKSTTRPHGIFHFEKSGFYRTALERKLMPGPAGAKAPSKPGREPAVLGLYHIGSLGTFTQSVGSDFDYWVLIDKRNFSEQRYYDLEKKLNSIVRHSREVYDQEVTFFVLDKEDIRKNRYASFKGKETLTAPKIFLKEEFYRTFLMIAGKIPFWAILPDTDSQAAYNGFIQTVPRTPGLESLAADALDLGHAARPDAQDVLKGILFHICKSRSDPVKALIKASMVYGVGMDDSGRGRLLCDAIKAGYADAGIDDYRVDPYKTLFDRIIQFHKTREPKGLNLVKNAIFFRLCGFPSVAEPEAGSPKRQLLDRYIREWNLSQSQVNKMLDFRNWAESEKLLLEKTMIQRLADMYARAQKKVVGSEADVRELITEKRNFKILTNKTAERLKKAEAKLPACSSFLRRQKLLNLNFSPGPESGWHLKGRDTDNRDIGELFTHPHFMGVLGWVLENRIYQRALTTLDINAPQHLFESHEKPVDPDKIYLVMQPLKPLSDDCFEHPPSWSKLVVLLVCGPKNHLEKAEFLAANTWGELFIDALVLRGNSPAAPPVSPLKNRGQSSTSLEKQAGMKDNYRMIAEKIAGYNTEGLRTYFFQLAKAHDPDAVYRIKHHMGSPAAVKRKTGGKPPGNRPLLDSL